MTRPTKRLHILMPETEYQRIAMQAHRIGMSVNRFVVSAAAQQVDSADDAARAQALAQAQTIAVVDALTERLEKSDASAIQRDEKLRADLRKSIDSLVAWTKGFVARSGAVDKKEQAK